MGRRRPTSARAGKTLLLKHGSLLNSTGFEKTQPNVHLYLTLNQQLTCWRKTKSMIWKKAPPRCTKTAGPQLHGELLLARCLVTTSTSLLSFNVFLFNIFPPNHLHLCSEAPASAYPIKTWSKHPCFWSAAQPLVPACQEKHLLTLLWDTAHDSEAAEGGMRKLTYPCTYSHSHALALPQILVPLRQIFHHSDKRDTRHIWPGIE